MMRISPIGIYKFREKGFTLLELLVALFLISLILTIVFPSFYGLQERKLKSEARTIASLLRSLHDNAVSTKETYSLKFDLEKRMISWDEPEGRRTEGFESLEGLNLQSRGEVKDGEIILIFGPLGIQENITVRLRENDQGMKVVFHSVSGRTKILEDGK